MLNIYHAIASLHPSSGGPARLVTGLVAELAALDAVTPKLFTQRYCDEEIFTGNLSLEHLAVVTNRSKVALKSGLPLHCLLKGQINRLKPDILHDHGMWLPINHLVARVALIERIPLVIHTHGMLEPRALSFRAYKKKIAWNVYQRKNLKSAALFFATSQVEADNLRKLNFTQPIAVIPNGVDMPDVGLSFNASQIAKRERNLVFIGRIHPIKGLRGLLEAWAKLDTEDWKLNLIGPDEDGYLQEVLAHAKKLRIESKVLYRGVMEGDEKEKLLLNADLFILPSLSENFGVVVAEALAYGVPVISTLGTPWRGLVENKCGWWVDAEPNALAGALREAMALSDKERSEMGVRGRRYAKKFEWRHIAQETTKVYHWLLGQHDRPESVRVD